PAARPVAAEEQLALIPRAGGLPADQDGAGGDRAVEREVDGSGASVPAGGAAAGAVADLEVGHGRVEIRQARHVQRGADGVGLPGRAFADGEGGGGTVDGERSETAE